MRRVLAVLLLVFFLFTGCGEDEELDRVIAMRERMQQSGCRFDAVITADYGTQLYTFRMACQCDAQGNLSFSVIEPETICGITGTISEDSGFLTFDDQVLAFELLADGQITPVSAPWLLIHTLRSGYLNACSKTDGGVMVIIDDSYQEDTLQLDIWLNENEIPVSAEILWLGRRIVSLEVKDFAYM